MAFADSWIGCRVLGFLFAMFFDYDPTTMVPRFGLPLASAFLLTLALPNELLLLGSPILGALCLAPLFLSLLTAPRPREAMLRTALFGLVFTAASNYWLANFGDFAVWTIGSVTAAYTLVYFVFGAFLWRAARMAPAYRPFALAGLWTVFDYIKSNGYLAYPWGLAAYPFNTVLPLIQVVDIAGLGPLTFWVVLANALLVEILLLRGAPALASPMDLRRGVGFFALVTALMLGYGLVRLAEEIPVLARFRVLLVQHNADPWADNDGLEVLRAVQDLTRAGAGEARPDLIVWSETVLNRPYLGYENWYLTRPHGDPFPEFLREMGVPLLTGAPVVRNRTPFEVYNGVLFISPDGGVKDFYAKQHPVPMAEHVPFWDFPPVRDLFRRLVGLQSMWSIGERDTVFSLPLPDGREVSFSTPICFEDAFAYLNRRFAAAGADILINLTNDSWSRTKSAQYQHFVAARFRSVELRRVMVRSTNSGHTSVIDPHGRVVADLPMFTAATLNTLVDVRRNAEPTPYEKTGDWFPLLVALVLILGVAGGRLGLDTVPLLKPIHAARGVDEFLLAREKGVALRTDFDLYVADR